MHRRTRVWPMQCMTCMHQCRKRQTQGTGTNHSMTLDGTNFKILLLSSCHQAVHINNP